MAAQTGVQVRVVFNHCAKAAAGIHAGAVKAVQTNTYRGEARAKQLVHVITGTLQRSIHSVFSNGGLTGTYGPSADYGKWEEWGSRGRAPHPFMRPSAEWVRPQFVADLEAVVRNGGL